MRLFIGSILISSCIFFATSCKDKRQTPNANSNHDSIPASMNRAADNGEKVEGRFVDIKKLTDKTYALSLLVSQDSVAVFETYMPLDENEITLLKKEGNNIRITYKVYQNPETKNLIKQVQYMQPVYEMQSR